jgi:hypothetical protein
MQGSDREEVITHRFTQLPIECVTGLTLARIMYDTCWYMWNVNAAIVALCISPGTSVTPRDFIVDGRNAVPSKNNANGSTMMKAPMVMMEKRPMEPPNCRHQAHINVTMLIVLIQYVHSSVPGSDLTI